MLQKNSTIMTEGKLKEKLRGGLGYGYGYGLALLNKEDALPSGGNRLWLRLLRKYVQRTKLITGGRGTRWKRERRTAIILGRLEDGIEKSSPCTSKGGIGRDNDRVAVAPATIQSRRSAGHEA